MTRRILGVTTLVAALVGIGSANAQADTIRVQSTTDTQDAGLVDGLLKPAYLAAQPGDTLSYVAVGTGVALDNARAGQADVVITHAPSLEALFVADGFSLEHPFGRAIFYSDYVIVGPLSDPANVLANHPHDAVGALEDIAAAGALGTADFVSRRNTSGTSVQEQILWGLTTSVTKHVACNAGADTTRYEPDSGTSPACPNGIPSWYHGTNQGQAANVSTTSACSVGSFPSAKCYTMTDRGTYNKLVNAGTVTNLKIVSEHNSTTARGGENLLINPFSVYIVDPAAPLPGGSPVPNVAAATRFVDFLASPGFQTAVDSFPNAIDPAFRGDAFAKVTLSPALSPTAVTGSAVPIHATLTNKLPGSSAVSGLPVQLQQSTDGGATFTDVGSPVPTSATGEVSFSPTLAARSTFRFRMPRYQTLSPNDQVIGLVSAIPGTTPPPPPGPPPPPPPPPPAAPDKTAPKVTKVKLAARKLSLTISEAGKVRATIAKKKVTRHKGRRSTISYKTVKTVFLKATKAGTISATWKNRLSKGSYRVKLRATDLFGNVRSSTARPPTGEWYVLR